MKILPIPAKINSFLFGLVFICFPLTNEVKAEFAYIAPDLQTLAPVMTIQGEPLSAAVRKIIPEGFTVTYGPDVSPKEKIQWNSGKPWPETLKNSLTSANLQFNRQGTRVHITKRPTESSIHRNWNVKKGQRLSGVLSEWGKKAKVRIKFLTDRDWPIEANFQFEGDFESATKSLLIALSSSNPAPIGELRNNRELLLILNRAEFN